MAKITKFGVDVFKLLRVLRALRGEGFEIYLVYSGILFALSAAANRQVPADLPGDHRIAFAFEQKLLAFGVRKFHYDPRIGFLGNENLSGSRLALQARRYIDRIADHRVVRHLAAADVADKRFARGDADSYAQAVYRRGCQTLAHDFAGGCHRPLRMIVAADRGAKKSHHLIADELVQSTVVTKDRVRRRLVEAIEPGSHLRRRELLGKRGEAANIDEQDRDVNRLPARRSQLVSERAKVGIFSRRTNLQQAKRQRADAEKRHETLFAAFV